MHPSILLRFPTTFLSLFPSRPRIVYPDPSPQGSTAACGRSPRRWPGAAASSRAPRATPPTPPGGTVCRRTPSGRPCSTAGPRPPVGVAVAAARPSCLADAVPLPGGARSRPRSGMRVDRRSSRDVCANRSIRAASSRRVPAPVHLAILYTPGPFVAVIWQRPIPGVAGRSWNRY